MNSISSYNCGGTTAATSGFLATTFMAAVLPAVVSTPMATSAPLSWPSVETRMPSSSVPGRRERSFIGLYGCRRSALDEYFGRFLGGISPSWLTPEVRDLLPTNDSKSFGRIELLIDSIRSQFPSCSVKLSAYVDGEQWRKLLLEVYTGIEDIDEQISRENSLYSFIDENAELRAALSGLVVSFL